MGGRCGNELEVLGEVRVKMPLKAQQLWNWRCKREMESWSRESRGIEGVD